MNSGLYIHIPFCKAKCRYCDFNSYAGMEKYIEPYFSALLCEAKHYTEETAAEFDTIYFGGGTPTSVNAKFLCQAAEKLFEIFKIHSDSEITAECNPGTIDFEGLKKLRLSGINRLSIGLQTTDDEKLKALGRIHTLNDFITCFENARKAGFDNISIDLMYGLPDMTLEDWSDTLDKVCGFGAEHISCYSLKIEDGTPFAKMQLNLPDDDISADMYQLAVEKLNRFGYGRYEISNFAKPGRESRHNFKYWHCDDFLGLGAGAYSCIGNRRFSNVSGLCEYIDTINSCGTAIEWNTEETASDKMSEFMFLGLRCSGGVSDNEFKSRFGCSFNEVFSKPIKKYTDWGFLILEGDCLKFSDKGFFVSNTILADFV